MAADPDTCPNCGERVESHVSYGIGSRDPGEELPEPTTHSKRCPSCGKLLRRSVGDSWTVDEVASAADD